MRWLCQRRAAPCRARRAGEHDARAVRAPWAADGRTPEGARRAACRSARLATGRAEQISDGFPAYVHQLQAVSVADQQRAAIRRPPGERIRIRLAPGEQRWRVTI